MRDFFEWKAIDAGKKVNKLEKTLALSSLTEKGLLEKENVALANLESLTDFSPKASLMGTLASILASMLILAVAIAYFRADNAPACPAHVNKGTLDNPIKDRNWRVEKCPDNRSKLDRTLKPITGIHR